MPLSNLIFITVILLLLFIFWKSGKLRALVTGFFNLFVEDLAATPEGAQALFNEKIDEVDEKYRRADNVYKKIAGQRKRCAEELASLKNQLQHVEKDCERLAKAADEEGLDIKIQQRADIIDDIEVHKETLTSLEKALKDATEARAACEENLNNLKKQSKQVVNKMKHNRDMKDIYDDLEGIGAGDHKSKLLDKVIERGTELDDLVAGSKEAYDTKTSTKARKLDKRLKSSANDDYKKSLMEKYNK
jgi:phage shock protein A